MDTTQKAVRHERCYDHECIIASFIHMIMIGVEKFPKICRTSAITAPNCLHLEGNEGSDNEKKYVEVMIACD